MGQGKEGGCSFSSVALILPSHYIHQLSNSQTLHYLFIFGGKRWHRNNHQSISSSETGGWKMKMKMSWVWPQEGRRGKRKEKLGKKSMA